MHFLSTLLTIQSLTIPRFIGGPIDGVTDSPYRKLIREFSPDALLYSEIRHVRSVAHPEGGAKALNFSPEERPLSFQVTANSTDGLEQACAAILAKGVDLVDLNIGCPARNITRSGSGSALMADLPRLKEIVTRMRKLLPIPFTVKMRAGYKEPNALEVAQLMQDCGVDAIAIHPRLQSEKFSGTPDYAIVAQIKKSVSIPVLFSGGIVDWQTAQTVWEQTGVDGFLIARGLWGQPWKLKELTCAAQGTPFSVDTTLRLACAQRHLHNLVDYYGQDAHYMFRKHVPHYLKNMPHASATVEKIMKADSAEQVAQLLQEFKNHATMESACAHDH